MQYGVPYPCSYDWLVIIKLLGRVAGEGRWRNGRRRLKSLSFGSTASWGRAPSRVLWIRHPRSPSYPLSTPSHATLFLAFPFPSSSRGIFRFISLRFPSFSSFLFRSLPFPSLRFSSLLSAPHPFALLLSPSHPLRSLSSLPLPFYLGIFSHLSVLSSPKYVP